MVSDAVIVSVTVSPLLASVGTTLVDCSDALVMLGGVVSDTLFPVAWP